MTSLVDAIQESEISDKNPDGRNVMRIMSPQHGDYKQTWDPDNADEVAQAEKTFNDLRKKGMVGYHVGRKGKKTTVMTKFDPDAESLIMAPVLVGG